MREVTVIEPKWLTESAPTFFKVADANKISKRKRQEKIEVREAPPPRRDFKLTVALLSLSITGMKSLMNGVLARSSVAVELVRRLVRWTRNKTTDLLHDVFACVGTTQLFFALTLGGDAWISNSAFEEGQPFPEKR